MTHSKQSLVNLTEASPPYTYLKNGIQKKLIRAGWLLEMNSSHQQKTIATTALSQVKAMLQGNVIMNWIEMYVAIDEFKSYLPHQPQLKSVNAMK